MVVVLWLLDRLECTEAEGVAHFEGMARSIRRVESGAVQSKQLTVFP